MPTGDDGVDRRSYLKAAGAAGVAGMSGLAGCTLGGTKSGSDTITIGGTVPLTGDFSSVGPDLKQGYNLGVEQINNNGGINGKQVKLVLEDDESDPKKVRSKLQKITSDNDVQMLWGSFSSLLVTAGSAYAESQKIPFLGIAFAYMEPHTKKGYEWTFAPFPKSRDVAASTKGMLAELPGSERPSKIGIWEPNSGWGHEQAEYWDKTLSAAGYDIALRKRYSIGAKDFSSLISQSKDAGVEVLLSNPIPPGAITAMKQMKSSGFDPKAVQFVRGADPAAWWKALGDTGKFATMCPGWVPGLSGNGNREMLKAYRKKYNYPSDKLLPVQVGTSYNLTQVANQALGKAKSTDPSDVQSALKSETFETVLGTFSFGPHGMPAEGQLKAPVGQWWQGGQHLVYPRSSASAAIQFQYPLTPWSQR